MNKNEILRKAEHPILDVLTSKYFLINWGSDNLFESVK